MFTKTLKTILLSGVMAATATSAIAADEQGFTGTVSAGIHFATGNTESEDYNLDGTLGFGYGEWKHTARAQFYNKKENDVRTNEEYRFGLNSRRDLTEMDYLFGEVEYVDDRFGGYDYRISEVLGYGRTWMKQDDFTWSSSAGVGMQHTKTTAGDKEDSALGRIQNDIAWDINKNVLFTNMLRADIAEINIYKTETALRTQLSEALYLKLAFQTETLSDVPAGREKTDTDTLLNLGYDF